MSTRLYRYRWVFYQRVFPALPFLPHIGGFVPPGFARVDLASALRLSAHSTSHTDVSCAIHQKLLGSMCSVSLFVLVLFVLVAPLPHLVGSYKMLLSCSCPSLCLPPSPTPGSCICAVPGCWLGVLVPPGSLVPSLVPAWGAYPPPPVRSIETEPFFVALSPPAPRTRRFRNRWCESLCASST